MSRLCEFFVIDKSEHFYIYNLTKKEGYSSSVRGYVAPRGPRSEGVEMRGVAALALAPPPCVCGEAHLA